MSAQPFVYNLKVTDALATLREARRTLVHRYAYAVQIPGHGAYVPVCPFPGCRSRHRGRGPEPPRYAHVHGEGYGPVEPHCNYREITEPAGYLWLGPDPSRQGEVLDEAAREALR